MRRSREQFSRTYPEGRSTESADVRTRPEAAAASAGRSSTLINRNVTIQGRRTSLRLEPAMWEALQEIAQRERVSVHDICTRAGAGRLQSTLTAAIRVYILGYFRAAATEQGHSQAGHGRWHAGALGGVGGDIAKAGCAGDPDSVRRIT